MTRRGVGLIIVVATVLFVILSFRRDTPFRPAPADDAGPIRKVRVASGSAGGGAAPSPAPPEVEPTAVPEPTPAPPTPDSVAAAYAANAQFVRACFDTLADSGVEHVQVRGRIGSVARHSEGPRGFVDEVEVALPDGSLASASSVHCFAAAANPALYATPPQGPVKFELTLSRPDP